MFRLRFWPADSSGLAQEGTPFKETGLRRKHFAPRPAPGSLALLPRLLGLSCSLSISCPFGFPAWQYALGRFQVCFILGPNSLRFAAHLSGSLLWIIPLNVNLWAEDLAAVDLRFAQLLATPAVLWMDKLPDETLTNWCRIS